RPLPPSFPTRRSSDLGVAAFAGSGTGGTVVAAFAGGGVTLTGGGATAVVGLAAPAGGIGFTGGGVGAVVPMPRRSRNVVSGFWRSEEHTSELQSRGHL